MTMDEKLRKALGSPEIEAPSAAARSRALESAMAAFETAQENASFEKISSSRQGNGLAGRLRSIASSWKGKWTMETRFALGTAMVALLMLPVGVVLMNNTALTPFEAGLPELANETKDVAEAPQPAPVPAPVQQPAEMESREQASTAESAGSAVLNSEQAATVPAAPPTIAPAPAPYDMGVSMQRTMTYMPEPFIPDMAGDRFTSFDEGGVMITRENPVSTFSIDVDTASYAYVRRMLEMGQVPSPDAVRVEELVNYFSYDYAAPSEGLPFALDVSVTGTPWNAESRLVRIGIQGEAVGIEDVPPANLVLLIDTSGSMDAPDKLPLLKRAFALLVNEMGPDDTISIVTYAGSAGVVLEPTPGSEKAKILAAVETLVPGGSTAGAQGIEAAYRLAEEAMIEGGTNRVLLATDGDFNVGIADPDGLERFIRTKRDAGIFLSVLGFGIGNYNDAVMQTLAQAGNGNAAYIDSYSEARRVLVEELGGTLLTIAKDVKIQVEFNPATVSEYRLIGYETRALNREDFNNDAVDAGDIGAGHTVTALYEITPVGARGSVDPLRYGEAEAVPAGGSDEYGFLKLRYKAPDAEVSQLIETPIPAGETAALAGDDAFAAAVAAFGQKLRGSDHLAAMSWEEIRALALAGRGDDPTGRRAEFLKLVDIASDIAP